MVGMAGTDRSGEGRVNVFWVKERFLFKHYFDGETVFARLKSYYLSAARESNRERWA